MLLLHIIIVLRYYIQPIYAQNDCIQRILMRENCERSTIECVNKKSRFTTTTFSYKTRRMASSDTLAEVQLHRRSQGALGAILGAKA